MLWVNAPGVIVWITQYIHSCDHTSCLWSALTFILWSSSMIYVTLTSMPGRQNVDGILEKIEIYWRPKQEKNIKRAWFKSGWNMLVKTIKTEMGCLMTALWGWLSKPSVTLTMHGLNRNSLKSKNTLTNISFADCVIPSSSIYVFLLIFSLMSNTY